MVEFWRLGGYPAPLTELGSIAARLESLGWDGLALGEGQGGSPDQYVCLTLAAQATRTLKIGSGASVPTRHPQITANAMATVNAVAGGRVVYSLGRGDGAMHQLGQDPMRLREFEQYVSRLQGYLRRETVDLAGFPSTISSLFERDAALDLPKPIVEISATGPKVVDLAARLGDGVTFSVGADVARLRGLIDQVRTTRAAAGLAEDGFRFSCYLQVAVGTGETLTRAREYIRGAVMTQSRFSALHGTPLPGISADDAAVVGRAVTELGQAYRTHGQRWGGGGTFYPKGVIDDDFVDRFAVVGSPEQCAEKLQPIIDLGFDRLVLITKGMGQDPQEENAARFAQEVIPLLRTA
ncbi:LLM class flavin-dependent oxidoreductase [Granulicoccus phenolivorans]|uniref:LLM class flavin-dependent oxidoreductase n=1 Tax=Granulicoccus phenolivorans TaxID=266854 RepID=UPI00047C1F7B|nr:LLM class flavin-dependent oxidoreductase [Granulicoccus phenolivorans]